MSRSVIRHKNPRGKLTHPSQGQELESAGRFTDQTKNIISSKKCEKVLYVTVIYTTNKDFGITYYIVSGFVLLCITPLLSQFTTNIQQIFGHVVDAIRHIYLATT